MLHSSIALWQIRIRENTRRGKLVARVQARRKVDVLDALFLSPELRFRPAGGMKTVDALSGFR